CARELGAYW
nr:immunoglobulin heavy chain junction region [Mus musculus]